MSTTEKDETNGRGRHSVKMLSLLYNIIVMNFISSLLCVFYFLPHTGTYPCVVLYIFLDLFFSSSEQSEDVTIGHACLTFLERAYGA
jgi:hypothetical protein